MRVVIAEDNVLLSSGLELLPASKGCEVAAVVRDGPALLRVVAGHRTDIAVVDVRPPPTFRDHRVRAVLAYLDGTRGVLPARPDRP